MRRRDADGGWRVLRAAIIACLATLAATAAATHTASAASLSLRPFQSVQVATADSGETAVVWRTTRGVTRVAVGTPGSTFSAPVTLADSQPLTSDPALAMDAAGDVVVLWEAYVLRDCGKYGDCIQSSLGVFAAIRPAGGSFAAPVRLAAAQPRAIAAPRLAMNRAGDWVVTLNVGTTTVVGAGRRTMAPPGFTALPMPSPLHTFGLDEAGATTFAGVDARQRPATVVRNPDGSFAAPQVLDTSTATLGVQVAVGPRGDALAVWPAGRERHWASRPPGGSFGPAASLPATTTSAVTVVAVGVDGAGRTMTIPPSAGPISGIVPFVVLRGTTAAPFSDADTLTAPGQTLVAVPTFAIGASGTAAVGWPAGEGRTASSRLSVAFDGGPFAPSLGLGASADTRVPAVAVDGAGRAVAAWLATSGEVQRVVAATFAPDGLTGSSIVTEAPLTALPPLTDPHAAGATIGQRLSIRRDGTVRPQVRCISTTTCRGTLRIDVRPAAGRKAIRLGARRFVLLAASARRLSVRATRAARRAALRHSLRATITIRTDATVANGAPPTLKTALTIRRTTAR